MTTSLQKACELTRSKARVRFFSLYQQLYDATMNAQGRTHMKMPFLLAATIFFLTVPGAYAINANIDTAKIEEIVGVKGKLNEKEATFKVSQPRSDVKISVDRWAMPP